MGRVFGYASVYWGSIPGWVIIKTKKTWHFMLPCLILSIIKFGSSVALWGLAAKADESVLARNQTKDSWTWNLAVSGNGKGTRERELTTRPSGDQQLVVGGRRPREAVGVDPRRGSQHQTPSREARRQDRVQWRRVSRCLIPVALWNFRW